jgi:hypothetical protein
MNPLKKINKIKISHECPISLLKDSYKFNDYEYCLVHLLDENEKYRNYYFNSKNENRSILLDNSLFELGEAFDIDKFLYWINKLQPDEYIIPDVTDDVCQTISNVEKWNTQYLPQINYKCKSIGVLQGLNWDEMKECYKYMDKHVDKIAINFISGCYKSWFPADNFTNRACFGRQMLIDNLLKSEIINKSKPHHLLGCTNPSEYLFYNYPDYEFNIESIDTSSPIVHAILGIKYPEELSDWIKWEKRNIKLADLINTPLENIDMDILNKNIKIFREFIY